ncbi:response regulator [Flavobacterium foetidum]|uniref:response regulator n=1 Tax=Flavobacterium foetidum TaxID=2026681 RepID=UPI0010753EBD|nr:response regulator [Flavobacterium foetidum]KAF2508312.1 response regulator [Flavobacterium foetidum]
MKEKVILLIDDDLDDTEIFTNIFRDADESVNCLCAPGGKEALKLLNTIELPSLILLDAGMPVMNGWEFLELLKKDNRCKEVPVIMIATSSRKAGIDDAETLGAAGYFVKPCDFQSLKDLLGTVCTNLGDRLKNALLNLQSESPSFVYIFPENIRDAV